MLKFASARFEVIQSLRGIEDRKYLVDFTGDYVIVTWLNQRRVIDNRPQKWGGRRLKPRMSDAFTAVSEVQGKRKAEPKTLAVVR